MFPTPCCNSVTVPAAAECNEPGEVTELVRGSERQLLERLVPMVRSQCITLDLGHVQRIDAAGIAALISLYCAACQSGHTFSIVNASPRVTEILGLVGLDHILISHNADQAPHPELELQGSAA